VLLLAAAALAAPPLPQLTGRGFAVGVGATGGAAEDPLTAPDCPEKGNCTAVRHRSGWGGELVIQVAPPLLGWVEAAGEQVKAPAAEYAESGFRLEGGAAVAFLPKQEVGALAWGQVGYGASGTEASASAKRWNVKAGGGARFGKPDGLFVGWIGGELVATGEDVTSTLDGALDVALAPTVPVNGVAGLAVYSEPMGGPGSSAPLMYFVVDGTVGAELGIRFGLGAAF